MGGKGRQVTEGGRREEVLMCSLSLSLSLSSPSAGVCPSRHDGHHTLYFATDNHFLHNCLRPLNSWVGVA